MRSLSQCDLLAGSGGESSAAIRGRVCAARARMAATRKRAPRRLGLSARAYDRILKLARTIADLAGARGNLTG